MNKVQQKNNKRRRLYDLTENYKVDWNHFLTERSCKYPSILHQQCCRSSVRKESWDVIAYPLSSKEIRKWRLSQTVIILLPPHTSEKCYGFCGMIMSNIFFFRFYIGFEEYHCNYCQADCTSLRVKCAECTDFDLCLQVRLLGAIIASSFWYFIQKCWIRVLSLS